MDLNIFVFGGFAKLIKARKRHVCYKCNKEIPKDIRYFFYSSAKYIPYYDDNDVRKCDRAYNTERYCVKCNTKQHYHITRSNKRRANCPDENFQFAWNGGWCNGAPDGGDGQYECHECNLHCN